MQVGICRLPVAEFLWEGYLELFRVRVSDDCTGGGHGSLVREVSIRGFREDRVSNVTKCLLVWA